ncbi:conserved hypothetical protein [Vibrio chagasii]|nr:conserved hypothetical protein [Vibrio chagasii]
MLVKLYRPTNEAQANASDMLCFAGSEAALKADSPYTKLHALKTTISAVRSNCTSVMAIQDLTKQAIAKGEMKIAMTVRATTPKQVMELTGEYEGIESLIHNPRIKVSKDHQDLAMNSTSVGDIMFASNKSQVIVLSKGFHLL